WVRRRTLGVSAIAGPDEVLLRTEVPLRGEDLSTRADFRVEPGETVAFVLSWRPSHQPSVVQREPEDLLTKTIATWRLWAGRCTPTGRWREAVLRSLITLKMLTFHPTGGIVAAPTTSLPELIGGVRNWDYRFCWIRDATFTLYAFLAGGYPEEARAWREWLLR